MNESLQISRDGRVLLLALNRPERRNALNMNLCTALAAALGQAEADAGVGAVLLLGNGRAFCAGMDLHEVMSPGGGDINAVHEEIFTAGIRMTKPLIAAVHGAALAGGTGLAANCHIVIAAEDATFGLTEIRIGLWPFVIFRTVVAALGQRRATELALNGRIFGASEAREYGLVHQVVEPGQLIDRAREMARAVAEASPTAIRAGLAFIRDARGKSWEETGELARQMRNEVFRSADFHEGIKAFQEKRPPRWPSYGAQDLGGRSD
ncbi:MAG TPA: enoyl-CoA hydratase/isomerase family protein [Bryobacteraceae bacterium]|nr:enoyl-CoA hydratase/isomerase family protein [Bryobacteraceae bacterium]